MRVGLPYTHNGRVENQLDHSGHTGATPEPRPKPTGRELALGVVVAVLFAAGICIAAVLSFEVNPAGPVIVVVAAITCGSLAVRRVEDYAFKAAAIGLVIGGIAAILLWPFFDVS